MLHLQSSRRSGQQRIPLSAHRWSGSGESSGQSGLFVAVWSQLERSVSTQWTASLQWISRTSHAERQRMAHLLRQQRSTRSGSAGALAVSTRSVQKADHSALFTTGQGYYRLDLTIIKWQYSKINRNILKLRVCFQSFRSFFISHLQ